MAKYKCPTLGDCDKANSGEIFERSPGEDLKCPNCATPMEPQSTAPTGSGGSKKRLPIMIGAAALVLLAGGGYFYSERGKAVTVAAASPEAAVAPAAAAAPAPAQPAAAGIAPSDAETKELRQQGEAQLASGDAEQAATASSRAAVNELLKLAIANMAQGKFDEAGKVLAQARERGPKEPLVYYNTAILRLRQGRTDDALKEFEASFMAGFNHFDMLEKDHDLDELRKTPRFAALIKQYDTAPR
jgi:tetratricopeptide (TPR) repeat protein